MKIKSKLYPYPVLSDSNDVYDSSFEFENFQQEYLQDVLNLSFDIILDNKSITHYIDKDKATYLVHIESPKTKFRKVYVQSNGRYNIKLDLSKIEEKLEICMFIVAKEDIPEYTIENANEEYGLNPTFDIHKGEILAYAKNITLPISKTSDSLKRLSTIINVELNDNDKKEIVPLDFDFYHNKIMIKLSKENFKNYTSFRDNKNYNKVFLASAVYPALVGALELMVSDEEGKSLISDFIWYKVMKKKLEKAEIDLQNKSYIINNKNTIALNLIGDPFTEIMDYLANGNIL